MQNTSPVFDYESQQIKKMLFLMTLKVYESLISPFVMILSWTGKEQFGLTLVHRPHFE